MERVGTAAERAEEQLLHSVEHHGAENWCSKKVERSESNNEQLLQC